MNDPDSTDQDRGLDTESFSDLEIRELRSQEDYAECVALQRTTWGRDYEDAVPPSVLQISQKMGGVVAGAFLGGEMVGFVYGLTGLRDGRLAHWSHMLAVVPRCRNAGVGRRLKEYQRDVVRSRGVGTMYWTFDPLVARNAHLNLNRLGARVAEFVPDLYGDTGSLLHRFGTDRFVAAWELEPEGGRGRTGRVGDPSRVRGAAPVVNVRPRAPRTPPAPPPAGAPVRVEVPEDVEAVACATIETAREWRASTRAAFLEYLGRGYRVTGFYRDPGGCFYVLEIPDEAG